MEKAEKLKTEKQKSRKREPRKVEGEYGCEDGDA
jgi:hypothetical protein